MSPDLLPRSKLTKKWIDELEERDRERDVFQQERDGVLPREIKKFLQNGSAKLLKLPDERYRPPEEGKNYYDWAKVKFLGEHYMASHEDILASIHKISAE